MARRHRRTIRIPAPAAKIGDGVLVRNYRTRPAQWEEGEVWRRSFCPAETRRRVDGSTYRTGASWHFDVRIDRPEHAISRGRTRTGYTVSVGNDGIRRLD